MRRLLVLTEPDRVALYVSADGRVIVPIVVIVATPLAHRRLARETQVVGDSDFL